MVEKPEIDSNVPLGFTVVAVNYWRSKVQSLEILRIANTLARVWAHFYEANTWLPIRESSRKLRTGIRKGKQGPSLRLHFPFPSGGIGLTVWELSIFRSIQVTIRLFLEFVKPTIFNGNKTSFFWGYRDPLFGSGFEGNKDLR